MKLTKKFHDSVADIVRSGQIRYSADINKMLRKGNITEDKINELVARMLQKDFGDVDTERARRFGNHMDAGDKDVYGSYDNIILYYDASRDQLTVVTRPEFTSYYTIDWTETDRHGFRERYDPARRQIGKSMPTDPEKVEGWKESMLKEQRVLTEGQQRETAKEAEKQAKELFGENTGSLRNFIRYEWKVFPVEDYTEFVRVLGPERKRNITALANEYGIPTKRLLAVIMYYYQVQRRTIDDAYNYVMKQLGEKRKAGIVASDSEE